MLPESEAVAQEVVDQAEEYWDWPWEPLPNGEPPDRVHGFMDYLVLLKLGRATLPEQIPHEWWVVFRDVYAAWKAKEEEWVRKWPYLFKVHPHPVFLLRCEDCHFALPFDDRPKAKGWQRCPVCQAGADRLWHMSLARWGVFQPSRG